MKTCKLISLIVCVSVFSTQVLYADEYKIPRKMMSASRVHSAPIIDAHLDEEQWDGADIASDFIQISPFNGKESQEKTEVRVIYDDYAVYIGAKMYDDNPENIHKELSARDVFNSADYFGVFLDPYNDAKNSYGFFVTASGVQIDMRRDNSNHFCWDAVWESATRITEDGWIAEIKIPYSALRFSKISDHSWAIQFERSVTSIREKSSWNFINNEVSGLNRQSGLINGIKNIKPPLRLSFMPYISSYFTKSSEKDNYTPNFKAGMDLKLGLSESFTMDMILIPDFGQVQSDDEQVNFSPFEIKHEEQRPFFMEGLELFRKGDIFYSRRIGSSAFHQDIINQNLETNEIIDDTPIESKLINASKISGKSKKGLSLGFLNALTAKQTTTITDTLTGESREYLIAPMTNYNMFVIDQTIGNHSNIAFSNTNVYRGNDYYMANVSSTEFRFADKQNIHSIFFRGAVSQKYNQGKIVNADDLGFKYYINYNKKGGKFGYKVWQNVESDTYDPNDMGFIRMNNELSNGLSLDYRMNEPNNIFLRWRIIFDATYRLLYKPMYYTGSDIWIKFFSITRNYFSTGFIFKQDIYDAHNYFIARESGKVVKIPRGFSLTAYGSPDYSRPFIVDFSIKYSGIPKRDMQSFTFSLSPRLRLGDKFLLVNKLSYKTSFNELDYVTTEETDTNDKLIYFGNTKVNNLINTLNVNYTITNKASFSLRMRYYWLKAVHDKYMTLNDNGYFDDRAMNDNHDFNNNFFNIDMVFLWHFAPGSEVSVVWKNAIKNENADNTLTLFDNINKTFDSPLSNSLSFKLRYYIDYQKINKPFVK